MQFSVIANNFEIILNCKNIKGDRPVNTQKHMPLVINIKKNNKS